ncbi:AbrB/MazE/SpoVT family DNA-binding domain-containing protein [Saccharopolyspora endophytica]|uniref:AbrB/MazE/SpoVT family DNA-binding domain-containing protein n=1 Tax=Saccharopolyspora endophytica TaxID=543886 RepID=A0ABS5DQZ5_9PSEU|nr:AbrB/MazE/SpoVT family DNA-binding domain-containing protein [Saccharopolyspora endophytica]MBQ0928711.1 AbrB/MazE/SpoVT family DNA-binding domain-containing protein [Saccharopolyspora endophytica]
MAESAVPAIELHPLSVDERAELLAARGTARKVPLTQLAALPSTTSMVYRIASVDPQGRIADSSIVTALGWQTGRRLRLEVLSNTTVTVQADPDGMFTLARRAHLPLPAAVRRWCGLNPGDRVLLAAAPDPGLLLIHTMRALDAMVAAFNTPGADSE